MIIAGIDEAGYGPTLGPLVVSASVFRLPEAEASAAGAIDLWSRLSAAVCRRPDGRRVAIDDSKKLFHQKLGLRHLEEGLLPFIALRLDSLPRDLRALLRGVARRGAAGGAREAEFEAYLDHYPWYRRRNLPIPVDTYPNVVHSRRERLEEALGGAGVEFVGLAARPVEVIEFNQALRKWENKALVSFLAVSSFLKRLWRQFPDEAVDVMIDRQGGRMRYGPLLFEKLRPRSLRIEVQSEELSTYTLARRRAQGGQRSFRVTFAVDSEGRSLPVALASMLSKYLRELHMLLFNGFWQEQAGNLKPTAGYALDARRFLKETTPLRKALGIDDALLIRNR